MQNDLFTFLINHSQALAVKLLEHIYLSLSATLAAILIGVPLGIWITRQARVRNTILNITSIFQTIPSLALLAFLVPFLGIGTKPTIVTLTIYALLPITRNTFTALFGLDENIIEAANGLGFTRWQRLYLVELPLALPIIIAGIRTATAMTVGITTIAAFIGAGGLGDFITQGLALDSPRLILLGAIPTALLALALDFLIAQIEIALTKRKADQQKHRVFKYALALSIAAIIIAAITHVVYQRLTSQRDDTVIVASKNFTEQFILADIMADLIQAKTHLHVVKKLNLGTTAIIQNALINGKADIYPEYTGTAYIVVLKKTQPLSPKQTYAFVKQAYAQQFHFTWLAPFGFNNSQTLAVTNQFAKQYQIQTLSQLVPYAPQLTLAAPAEFLKRSDAFPGLKRVYGFQFKNIRQMQPDLMYQAIKNNNVNVIEVFTTDARIKEYQLTALQDDKHFYPPYDAAPVIRDATLKAHPQIRQALAPLAGLINNQTMLQLNYQVDVLHQSPQQVARRFLIKHHLIK